MTTLASKALEMAHERDPRLDILDAVARYLDGIEVIGSDILVGAYKRPEKTKGGVFITQASRAEENFQGVAGLVLKMGPLAFVEDDKHKFPVKPRVGDWIVHPSNQCVSIHVGPAQCRIVNEDAVRMVIDRPDIVY
jgi:co-chaperonin GroES (HSP10)